MHRSIATLPLMLVLAAGFACAQPARADDGPTVFKAQKCHKCHSAPGIKGGRSDLSSVGKRLDEKTLRPFLKKEAKVGGRKHRVPFKGSDKELDALVKWLASLKK